MLGSVEKSFVALMYAGALMSSVSAETVSTRFKPSMYLSVACEVSSMSLPSLILSRSISSVTSVTLPRFLHSSSHEYNCTVSQIQYLCLSSRATCLVGPVYLHAFQFVDSAGVLVEDLREGVSFEAEVGDGLGVGFRAGDPGPVGAEDHLPCQALKVEVLVVVGELFGGKARDLDVDVGAHERDEGRRVVPPAATAVGEDDGEVGEVAGHVLYEGGIGVAVGGPGEDARAAVEDDGEVLRLAVGVGRVEHPVVRGERAVDRVELQPDGAQGDLALQLPYERVVQVRVQVRHQAEAVGVVLEDGEHVFDGLDAGGLRAVLGEQDRDVHTFCGHVLVEAGRDHGPFVVVELQEVFDASLEVPGPFLQGHLQRGQSGRVYVGV